MNVQRHDITLSASTGDATAQNTTPVTARILSIHYQSTGATDGGFATTAVVSVVTEVTRQTIWSETLSTLATTTVNIHRAPRIPVHTSAGAAHATSGLFAIDTPYVGNERLVVTATAVGSGARSATLRILTG